ARDAGRGRAGRRAWRRLLHGEEQRTLHRAVERARLTNDGDRTMSPRLSRMILMLSVLALVAPSASVAQAPPPGRPAPVAAPDSLKKAQDVVRAAMKPPTFADIRPSTPAPPFKSGLKIAVILATARSTGAQIQARGVKEAATAVGWTTVEFDGQGTNQG